MKNRSQDRLSAKSKDTSNESGNEETSWRQQMEQRLERAERRAHVGRAGVRDGGRSPRGFCHADGTGPGTKDQSNRLAAAGGVGRSK